MQLSSCSSGSKCEFEMAKSSKPRVVSPSLIARVNSIDTTKKVPDEVKLGMNDWTDSDSEKENDDFQPPKKHQKVPASLKGKQRFTEMVSSEQLETISKGFQTVDCFTKPVQCCVRDYNYRHPLKASGQRQ